MSEKRDFPPEVQISDLPEQVQRHIKDIKILWPYLGASERLAWSKEFSPFFNGSTLEAAAELGETS